MRRRRRRCGGGSGDELSGHQDKTILEMQTDPNVKESQGSSLRTEGRKAGKPEADDLGKRWTAFEMMTSAEYLSCRIFIYFLQS